MKIFHYKEITRWLTLAPSARSRSLLRASLATSICRSTSTRSPGSLRFWRESTLKFCLSEASTRCSMSSELQICSISRRLRLRAMECSVRGLTTWIREPTLAAMMVTCIQSIWQHSSLFRKMGIPNFVRASTTSCSCPNTHTSSCVSSTLASLTLYPLQTSNSKLFQTAQLSSQPTQFTMQRKPNGNEAKEASTSTRNQLSLHSPLTLDYHSFKCNYSITNLRKASNQTSRRVCLNLRPSPVQPPTLTFKSLVRYIWKTSRSVVSSNSVKLSSQSVSSKMTQFTWLTGRRMASLGRSRTHLVRAAATSFGRYLDSICT